MSETFVYHGDPKFIFYVNYKVMFSTLYVTLQHYFPGVERNKDQEIGDLYAYLKLGIVRNPYARFVSLYTDKCISDPKSKLKLLKGIFLQPVQGQVLEELVRLRGQPMSIARTWEDLTNDSEESERCKENLRTLQTISFGEFIIIAQRILGKADADPHFHPQHRLYFKSGRCVLDHLFRLEYIEEDWEHICKLLDKPMGLTWQNRTPHQPYYQYYRDIGTAAAIYSLYKTDFSLFSYSKYFN